MSEILSVLLVDPFAGALPEPFPLSTTVPHSPKRNAACLSKDEVVLAVKNALRYVPERWRELHLFLFACFSFISL